jgi:hypothetical protein
MYEVDPAGDRLDAVHRVGQVDASRVRVASVQAEADLAVAVRYRADALPKPGDRLKLARHRLVTARGVLDQQRQRPVDLLDRLHPVGYACGGVGVTSDVPPVHDEPLRADRRCGLQVLVEQLPARDADPVVGGRHVDHVRRVDVNVHVGRGISVAERTGITTRDHRALPPLRVTEEELRHLCLARNRIVQRVIGMEVPANAHHG